MGQRKASRWQSQDFKRRRGASLSRRGLDLDRLFDSAREALFLWYKGERPRLNTAAARLLAVDPDSGAPTAAIEELLAPPADLPPGELRSAQRQWESAQGSRWLQVVFLPLSSDDKHRTGVLGIVLPELPKAPIPSASDSLLTERVARLRSAQRAEWGFDAVPARGAGMVRLLDQVRLASQTRVPVAWIGEWGAGKEALARLVHYEGHGLEANFIPFDARSLPPEEQRQTLLGRVEADPASPAGQGLLRAPGPGTLLIQGASELIPDLQVEIVRLWNRRRPDWRLMVSERMPLEPALADGRLTSDFYHLVTGLVIRVPPLRERRQEFRDHCDWVLFRLRREGNQPALDLDPAAYEMLLEYDWPGNLRELETVLKLASEKVKGTLITPNELPRRLRRPSESELRPAESRPISLDLVLEQVERRLFQVALERHGGNKSKAAESLGLSRARFLRRLAQWSNPPTQDPEPGS